MGKRILIIEDDLDLLEALKIEAEDLGYDVVAKSNASDAVANYMDNEYDIVSTDFDLGRQNGVVLTKALKAIDPSPKFIMLTGHGLSKQADFEAAGGDICIDKMELKDWIEAITIEEAVS